MVLASVSVIVLVLVFIGGFKTSDWLWNQAINIFLNKEPRKQCFKRFMNKKFGKGLYFNEPVVFETRKDAEEIFSHLQEIVNIYGFATIADLKDLSGLQSNFKDNKYGWKKLNQAMVQRIKYGYLITLPEVSFLKGE